jgi:hypothetical protein
MIYILTKHVLTKPTNLWKATYRILLIYSLLNLISSPFKPLLYKLYYIFNISAMLLYFLVYFLFFHCFSDFQQLSMEPRYFCTICLQRPTLPFFLKDASSLSSSKVFATYYPCRERRSIQRKKKRPSLQEIDPNIGPPPTKRHATSISRAPFQPFTVNQGPILLVRPPVSLVQPLWPPTIQPPLLVEPPLLIQPSPPESFLPADQW